MPVLTIVALGTDALGIAVSVGATMEGRTDIAIGNVIGSNTFDIWVMLTVALACLPVFVSGRQIARWEGGVFMGCCLAYTAYVVLTP